MKPRYVSIVLVLVGVSLLASGGWLRADIEECRNTQNIIVEQGFSGPEYDIQQFETLSDRQQEVFLRAVDNSGSYIEAERDVRFSGAVEYENTTYGISSVHADDCGRPIGDFLVWGAFILGAGGLVAGISLRLRAYSD